MQPTLSSPSLLLLTSGVTEAVPATVGGERELIIISNRYTVTTRINSALKVGSDVSHFNVSLVVPGKVTVETVSINHHFGRER